MENQIRANRIRLGMSQEELAGLSGLSLRTVQRIETGQTEPRGDSLKRIAQALSIDITELTEEKLVQQPVQSNADPRLAILTALSAFTFLINPFLGLILPLILFVLYKNTNAHVRNLGKKIVLIEAVNCGLLVVIGGYLMMAKMFHLPSPEMIPFKQILIGYVASYVLHFAGIVYLLVVFVRKNRPLKAEPPVKEILQ